MLVVMLTEHVTRVPPLLPVPLHWLTRSGIAALTLDVGATEQATVEPPPVAEPLHWVTVAPVVLAGYGLQMSGPDPSYLPPPVPEPTHWLTLAVLTGAPPGVPALMLLVTLTRHVTRGGAASLAEPLHWVTVVTRDVDVVVNVPLPGGHGPREHCRVTVVVEPRVFPLIVLTTVTVQVSPVVAPLGLPSMLLHWLMLVVAADATSCDVARAATDSALASRRVSAAA